MTTNSNTNTNTTSTCAAISLADAILLGATITEPRAGDLNHCGLGMAANALGIVKHEENDWDNFYHQPRVAALVARYPWLRRDEFKGWSDNNWGNIAYTFNNKVADPVYDFFSDDDPPMTMEQFVAMVREMEDYYRREEEQAAVAEQSQPAQAAMNSQQAVAAS